MSTLHEEMEHLLEPLEGCRRRRFEVESNENGE